MNFKQLQDAVLANSFDESRRADAMNWINARYWMLWNHADWAFREETVPVTVTAGSYNVSNLPADFLVARALQRDDSTPLIPIYLLQDFQRYYVGSGATQAGIPEAYTVISTTLIQVGPVSSVSSNSYQLTYQQDFTPLTADGQSPQIPAGAHMALVFGGKAEGFVLDSILLADPFEARYQEYLNAMMGNYVSQMDSAGRQAPAWRASPIYDGY